MIQPALSKLPTTFARLLYRSSAGSERVLFAPSHKNPESAASRGSRFPFDLCRVFLTIDWLILTTPVCGYGRPYWCNSF